MSSCCVKHSPVCTLNKILETSKGTAKLLQQGWTKHATKDLTYWCSSTLVPQLKSRTDVIGT